MRSIICLAILLSACSDDKLVLVCSGTYSYLGVKAPMVETFRISPSQQKFEEWTEKGKLLDLQGGKLQFSDSEIKFDIGTATETVGKRSILIDRNTGLITDNTRYQSIIESMDQNFTGNCKKEEAPTTVARKF